MHGLLQDFAYAARRLIKAPAFSLVAVFTIAVGMGAVTGVYSVVDGVLLKPLPYRDPDNLLRLYLGWLEKGRTDPGTSDFSTPQWAILDWREHCTAFDSIAVRGVVRGFNFRPSGAPVERVLGTRVTGNFFATLGVGACVGRTLLPEESAQGAARVVVLSHGYWKRRFGADPAVVGKTFVYDNVPRLVVGVLQDVPMPKCWVQGGEFLQPEIYVPINEQDFYKQNPESLWHTNVVVYARLKPGFTLEQAREQLVASGRRLYETPGYPEYFNPTPERQGQIIGVAMPLREDLGGPFAPYLWVIFGTAVTVLLIACANTANLFLARGAETRRETTIRSALGAPPSSLIRLVLVESTLVALAGAALGALAAYATVPVLLSMLPPFLPRTDEVGLDLRVIGVTFAMALGTGVLCGVSPSLRVFRLDLQSLMKQGGRTTSSGRGHNLFRNGLVAAEIAVALVVLFGAGLFSKVLVRSTIVDAGFEEKRLLTAQLELRDVKDDADICRFVEQVLESVETLPDIQSAGFSHWVPLADTQNTMYRVHGVPDCPEDESMWPFGSINPVTPDYFKALGIPLLRGRTFARTDTVEAEPVVIVDSDFERRWFPGKSALGATVEIKGSLKARLFRVVGVVGHIKTWLMEPDSDEHRSWGGREFRGQLYVPHSFLPTRNLFLTVRTRAEDPYVVLPSVRKAIASLYPDQPVYSVRNMEEVRDRAMALEKGLAVPSTCFAFVGLVLSAVGCYSVMACRVAQCRHEIGTRMALGATPARIVLLVMRQAGGLILAGCVLGLLPIVAAASGSRYAENLQMDGLAHLLVMVVRQVAPQIWLFVAGAVVALACVVSVSAFLSARKAARLDPILVLREE